MLVLTRQREESVVIGNDVTVKIVDIRGDKVRLGITAPQYVSVHRQEVYDEIVKENRRAAQMRTDDVPSPQGGLKIPPPPPPAQAFPRLAVPEAHDGFITAAIEEAMVGLSEGGLPIGSVLVREGKIVARGHNRRCQNGDPMAHAEIDCLRRAGRQKSYGDTVLYSTLMPCYLCSGAAVQFGIPRIVVGESVNFGGAPRFLRDNGIEVVDLHDRRCIDLMADFITRHPDVWHEDIGK